MLIAKCLLSVQFYGCSTYELDPEYAYAETCAALASMFWDWEMAQLTNEAKYSDLHEWQLYNAAAVGMGLDGTTYLYNNPLTCRGGVTRKPWYSVPCCPSNLSRTWANLRKYIYSDSKNELWIHQYISSQFENDFAKVELHSEFPWNGRVEIKIKPSTPRTEFTLHMRMPSWSLAPQVKVNEQGVKTDSSSIDSNANAVAQGYDPRQSRWLSIRRLWNPNDVISLTINMPIQFRRAHPKVKGHKNKVAVTRGPLVCCLESADNPDLDIFNAAIKSISIEPVFDTNLLGGIVKLIGQTKTGEPLTFIPYHLWGNRGDSTMTVRVNE